MRTIRCICCALDFQTHEPAFTTCPRCLTPAAQALRMYLVPEDFGEEWAAMAKAELNAWEERP